VKSKKKEGFIEKNKLGFRIFNPKKQSLKEGAMRG